MLGYNEVPWRGYAYVKNGKELFKKETPKEIMEAYKAYRKTLRKQDNADNNECSCLTDRTRI